MGERRDALVAASKLVEAVREIATRLPGRRVYKKLQAQAKRERRSVAQEVTRLCIRGA